jgi:hypothetical protein
MPIPGQPSIIGFDDRCTERAGDRGVDGVSTAGKHRHRGSNFGGVASGCGDLSGH